MILNVILAILVLSLIIIIHEFGHFIIAKANGVHVLEFAVGMGPKILSFNIGETKYSFSLLLFGGYCMMLGDEYVDMLVSDSIDADTSDDDYEDKKEALKAEFTKKYDESRSYDNKQVWARIAITLAGPVFNFFLAFVCAVIIIGNIGFDPAVIDNVADNSVASAAGLVAGDKIVKIDNKNIHFAREYSFFESYHGDKSYVLTYKRDGKEYKTTINPEYVENSKYVLGIVITQNCGVNDVSKDSAASAAGFLKGDVIEKVNDKSVTSNTEITDLITASQGQEMTFVVIRDGKEITLTATPNLVTSKGYTTGISVYGQRVKVSPLASIKYSFMEVGYDIGTVLDSLGMLFTGKLSVNNLSGPVGTVSAMSEIVEESKADGAFYVFLNLVNLCGLISANLGVMNLLPIPGLDGGKLILLLIEDVRGKPIDKKYTGVVTIIGVVFLVALMAYVLFHDIYSLF
jgi:regulator of sigma E protease